MATPCDGDNCGQLTEERGGRRVDAGTDNLHTCPDTPAWIRAWARTALSRSGEGSAATDGGGSAQAD